MISVKVALDVAGQRLELRGGLDHVRAAARCGRPGRAPRRRSRRSAPARSPGRGSGSSRRAPSASARRPRRRRRRRASSGPGSSSSGSREATIASMRSPERTSLTSLIERSWPTASGVSVSGKVTMSLQRQHRERRRQRLLLALADRLLDVRRLDDLDRGAALRRPVASPPARSGPGGALWRAGAERQLDPQHAVLVGGLRLLGDDVGVQLDHAAERAGLDLDLLVDAALGLLHRALAGDHQLAPGDLEADRRPGARRRARP